MRLLITRPAEDAASLAETLAQLGHRPVVHPLLVIVYPPAASLALDDVQAVIATSRNGLRGLARNPALAEALFLPLFCVGPGSAALARSLGFADIRRGAGRASDLVRLIAAAMRPDAGALLYLAGDHLAFDLPGALERRGYRVMRPVLYRAVPATSLPAALQREIRGGKIDGAVFMSPRTAHSYAALVARCGLVDAARRMVYYCLSPGVAQGLETLGAVTARVASRPDQEELLALIGRSAETGGGIANR